MSLCQHLPHGAAMATHPPLSCSGSFRPPTRVASRRIWLRKDESGRCDRQVCRPRDVLARAVRDGQDAFPGPQPRPMSRRTQAVAEASVQAGRSIAAQISQLQDLRKRLESASDPLARLSMLRRDPLVSSWAATPAGRAILAAAEGALDADGLAVLLLLPAMGQGHVLSVLPTAETDHPAPSPSASAADSTYSVDWGDGVASGGDPLGMALAGLVRTLSRAERFYDSIGGLVGYQIKALQLIEGREEAGAGAGVTRVAFHTPTGPDISDACAEGPERRRRWAGEGLRVLPRLAEIYPVGGAGDRLGLVDEATGEALPTAVLPYAGRSLLEGLVRDLEAREYLHWRVTGEQHTTPVVMMTSQAKGNHARIVGLLEECGWMGRGRESFYLVEQPMVPVVSAEDGAWLLEGALSPMLKPGGHGALWKLMEDEGAFAWLASRGRTAAIVRQISNPMAGTDANLLALAGAGCLGNKAFGFASCGRAYGASEGINVLVERHLSDGSFEYGVSNIEYTDFDRIGFCDELTGAGESKYPANTNVLFVDLKAVRGALARSADAALPGLIFNTSKKVTFRDASLGGATRQVRAGRLETTMQNVADYLADKSPSPLSPSSFDQLSTFVVFNERRKLTSSAKRQRRAGDPHLHQTPDGSFLDLSRNARDLLLRAGWEVPEVGSQEAYLAKGPSLTALVHPGVGPLWEVAAQKLGPGGRAAGGAELVLEVAEVCLRGLDLDGSLRVEASCPLGHTEAVNANDDNNNANANDSANSDERRLVFSDRGARCRMVGCRVVNAGVDRDDPANVYWKQRVSRKEGMLVLLEGRSEFDARDVTFTGSHTFVVPDGARMTVLPDAASPEGFKVQVERLAGDEPSWVWEYALGADGAVTLTMRERGEQAGEREATLVARERA